MRRSPRPRGTFGGKVRDLVLAVFAVLAVSAVVSPTASSFAADKAEPPASPDPTIKVEEELTVTDTRLRDEPDERRRVPAHVTVITRDEIESSGVRTLQDLLSLEAGVVVIDDIGNDIQKSFDLRGFGAERSKSATRVYLDGAPLNETRNNALQLELVPLSALDRVEITRGSSAALVGGGSEAGVINLWTRHAADSGASISAAAGDFSTQEGRASVWRDFGDGDLFLTGSHEETDGFRDNSGGDLDRFQGSLGWDLAPERRLSLSLLRSNADLGSPGALTLAEIEDDREQAPFNQFDFIDEDIFQGTLTLDTTLGSAASLVANLFAREREDDTLTTGRAAPLFGGFASNSDSSVAGSTVQLSQGQTSAAAPTAGPLGSSGSTATPTRRASAPRRPTQAQSIRPASSRTTPRSARPGVSTCTTPGSLRPIGRSPSARATTTTAWATTSASRTRRTTPSATSPSSRCAAV